MVEKKEERGGFVPTRMSRLRKKKCVHTGAERDDNGMKRWGRMVRESVKKMKIRRMPPSGVFPPATYVRFATIIVTDVHGGFQYVGDKGCFSVESRGDYHVQPLAARVSLALYSLSARYACEISIRCLSARLFEHLKEAPDCREYSRASSEETSTSFLGIVPVCTIVYSTQSAIRRFPYLAYFSRKSTRNLSLLHLLSPYKASKTSFYEAIPGFWFLDRLRLDSAVAATDGVLVLEEYSAILPFPASPFPFLCGRAPLSPFPSSYPPLPSPRFDQSLESSRLRGTPNVTAISRSVSEEDGGRNVEHDCQTRNSSFVLRCSSNQYEKRMAELRRRLHINQRALINRQDANQERPASRSIGGLPETFRSCSPQRTQPFATDCAATGLYPRVRPMLSSFEIERRSCEDWKAAIPAFSSYVTKYDIRYILKFAVKFALSGSPRHRAIHDDWKVISRISRTSLDIGRFPGTSFVPRYTKWVRAEETFQLGSQSVEQSVKASGGVKHVYRDR
ncbi:hypothetical protein ALC62_09395 [Cyphomyrmex costatus]|uniref:Uncharacterized protein n=1 Tax=Cyphomyrmex costatus TaxID=456900 RepID=A0A195CGD1_9HYME|nr:hypothetical protein ALC62_09395 [Cyphomyrmex costatus]